MAESGMGTTKGLPDAPEATPPPQSATSDATPPTLWSLTSSVQPGVSLGRYLVIEELGYGGMGTVLRAYDPKLQREVALKLLRPGVLDSTSEVRMVREARAMAKLSHPNVVAVYDVELGLAAGVILAMEYVAGGSLRRWLKTPRPWAEVVAAFVAAGRGLAAAHAKDLLHRDFKPANVLVTDDGGVKVTDFGLAKFGGARGSESGGARGRESHAARIHEFDDPSIDDDRSMELTQANMVMGTPRYMAPEQHAGDELDARTDQYAFCVAAWEALTGRPPFAGHDMETYERAKLGDPPAWPKGTSVPVAVRRALARGLATDPSQRWPTMEELLAALQQTPGRRRQVALGVGVAAALAGLLWTRAGAAPDERCTGARAQLSGVWSPAQRLRLEEAMAATGLAYATKTWTRTAARLDAYADAWAEEHAEACEATTLRGEQSAEMMDLRMGCLRRARVELSAVVGALLVADDETMANAHRLVDGLPTLERCQDIEALAAEVPPPDDRVAAKVGSLRAELAEAKVQIKAGHYDRAVERLEELEPQVDAVDYGPLRTEALQQRGYALNGAGRYDEAATALKRALRSGLSWQQRQPTRETATMLALVAGARQGRADEGLAYLEMAWGLLGHRPDARAKAHVHDHLGVMLQLQGKYEQAEAEHRTALSIQLEALGPDHLGVAATRSNLGNALESQGKYEQAQTEHRAVLSLRLEVLGPDHPQVAASRNNLGNVLDSQGKYEQAEAEYRAALSLRLRVLGPGHPKVASSHNNVGVALDKQGKHEQAEAEYRAALAIQLEALGPDHPHVAESHNNLGLTLWLQGKHEQAEAEYRAALTIQLEAHGPDHPRVASLHSNIGALLASQGKQEQAEAEHRAALAIRLEALAPDHPHVAMSRYNLGAVLAERGEYEQAEAEHRAALSIRLEVLDPDHPHVAKSRYDLASLLHSQGKDLDEALEHAEAAWTRHMDPDAAGKTRAATAFLLAQLLWPHPDERPRARTLARTARDAYTQAGSTFDQDRAEVEAWLRTHR